MAHILIRFHYLHTLCYSRKKQWHNFVAIIFEAQCVFPITTNQSVSSEHQNKWLCLVWCHYMRLLLRNDLASCLEACLASCLKYFWHIL